MAKNLFIIGAGASKDFKSNMPLGEDLINYFANLRCIIICRIVLLVFDAIDNKHSSNDEKELCIVREIKLHDLNILINSIDKEKIFNKSVIGKENNEDTIKPFLKKLLKQAIQTKHIEWKTKEQITKEKKVTKETIEFFLTEKEYNTRRTFGQYLSLFQALCFFSLHCSDAARVNILLEEYENSDLVEKFNEVLQDVTKEVFKTSGIKNELNKYSEEVEKFWLLYDKNLLIIQNEIEKYIKQGITLSNVVNYQVSNTSSIDYIINFLTDLTNYKDELASSSDLPSVEDLTIFVKLFCKRIISFYMGSLNSVNLEELCKGANYINYLYHYSGINAIETVKTSDFIILNYDIFLEKWFTDYIIFLNRYEDSCYLLKKLYDSHLYGATHNIKKDKLLKVINGEYRAVDKYYINQENNNFITQDPFELWFRSQNFGRLIILDSLRNLEKMYKEFISIDTTTDNLQEIIRGIELIRVSPISEQITKQFEKINTSNNIYILGFGFDKWNLVNIGLLNDDFTVSEKAKNLKNKRIFITDYSNSPKIRILIEDLFDVILRKESEENIKIKNNTASKRGKLVTYYFWKGVNKERDLKVYVSTKGVYQALKEDFGL